MMTGVSENPEFPKTWIEIDGILSAENDTKYQL